MTVVKAELKADGRNLRETFAGAWVRAITTNASGITVNKWPMTKVSGSAVYLVFSDSPTETALGVMRTNLLPTLGTTYVDEGGIAYPGVTYTDRTPRYVGPRGNYFAWEVSYTISGETTNAGSGSEQPTTLLTFDCSAETYEEASMTDLHGFHNVNTLGQFFDDPLMFERGILNMNYKRREYRNPLALMLNLLGSTNDATLWGLPPGTVKFSDMSWDATVTDAGTEYDVSYRLQYKTVGWNVRKANAGYYYVANGSQYRALNADGSPTETPVLLAASGALLPLNASPFFRSFQVCPRANLLALGLPNPFTL